MLHLNPIPWTTPKPGQLVRNKRTGKVAVVDGTLRGRDAVWYEPARPSIILLSNGERPRRRKFGEYFDLLLEPYTGPEQGSVALCALCGEPPGGHNHFVFFDSLTYIWFGPRLGDIYLERNGIIAGDGTPPDLRPLQAFVDMLCAWRDFAKEEQ